MIDFQKVMETKIYKSKRSLMPMVLIYELLGSALVTYSFVLGSQSEFVRAVAFLIGWTLASTISGAHFNPAITLAVFFYKRKIGQWPCMCLMIVAQLLGCFI